MLDFLRELRDSFWDVLLGGVIIMILLAAAYWLCKLWLIVAVMAWKHSVLACILVTVITAQVLGILALLSEDIT